MILTNGSVYGVDFAWDQESTFLLQGSGDLVNWTNVAYVWSWPPQTVWTTNQPLNNFGNAFRLELAAGTHATNLPPLNSSIAQPRTTVPALPTPPILRVIGCRLAQGKAEVTVSTSPGQDVEVEALDLNSTILQSRHIVAKGNTASAAFDAATLPPFGYFRAKLAP